MFYVNNEEIYIFFKEVLFTKKTNVSNMIFYTIFLCVCYIYKNKLSSMHDVFISQKKSQKRFSALCYLI